MTRTFFKYIFKMQLKSMTFVGISVFCLILLFDFAEMARKYPISNFSETWFAIKLALLRSPSTFCEVLHYVYFITATFSLWNLCASQQLTILKSTGQSPRQILRPFISFAMFMSAIWLFVFHPLGLFTQQRYDQLANHSSITKANNDIWIDYTKKNQVIFIKNITKDTISDLYIFNTKDRSKLFAQHAKANKNKWILNNVTTINDGKTTYSKNQVINYNLLSPELLSILSASPRHQNIYNLCKVYSIEKNNGVSLKLYELTFHNLLANGMSFILFALIAAIICFPINRYKTKTNIAIKVIFASIMLRFCNNMFESLAYSGIVPVWLACWATVLILLCISIAILIWKEA